MGYHSHLCMHKHIEETFTFFKKILYSKTLTHHIENLTMRSSLLLDWGREERFKFSHLKSEDLDLLKWKTSDLKSTSNLRSLTFNPPPLQIMKKILFEMTTVARTSWTLFLGVSLSFSQQYYVYWYLKVLSTKSICVCFVSIKSACPEYYKVTKIYRFQKGDNIVKIRGDKSTQWSCQTRKHFTADFVSLYFARLSVCFDTVSF